GDEPGDPRAAPGSRPRGRQREEREEDEPDGRGEESPSARRRLAPHAARRRDEAERHEPEQHQVEVEDPVGRHGRPARLGRDAHADLAERLQDEQPECQTPRPPKARPQRHDDEPETAPHEHPARRASPAKSGGTSAAGIPSANVNGTPAAASAAPHRASRTPHRASRTPRPASAAARPSVPSTNHPSENTSRKTCVRALISAGLSRPENWSTGSPHAPSVARARKHSAR